MIALVVGGWLLAGLTFGQLCRVGMYDELPVENKSRDAILDVTGQGGR